MTYSILAVSLHVAELDSTGIAAAAVPSLSLSGV